MFYGSCLSVVLKFVVMVVCVFRRFVSLCLVIWYISYYIHIYYAEQGVQPGP